MLFAGPTDPSTIDPRLIAPFFDRVLPCLPSGLRKKLYCGVQHDRAEEFTPRAEHGNKHSQVRPKLKVQTMRTPPPSVSVSVAKQFRSIGNKALWFVSVSTLFLVFFEQMNTNGHLSIIEAKTSNGNTAQPYDHFYSTVEERELTAVDLPAPDYENMFKQNDSANDKTPREIFKFRNSRDEESDEETSNPRGNYLSNWENDNMGFEDSGERF